MSPRAGGSRSGGPSPWLIVGTLILLLLLVGVAVWLGAKPESTGSRGWSPAGEFAAATQAADERAVQASRQKYGREIRFCEALGLFEGADLACLADFAAEHKDVFFCGEIPAASREDCLHRVARAAGQGRLCDGIAQPEMRRDCFLDAAAKGGDAEACERLADVPTRRACEAVARQDPAGCEAVSESSARFACFHRLAVRMRKPDLCKNLEDRLEGMSSRPRLYECWNDAAVATGLPEECDRIPHEGIHVDTLGWNWWRTCRERTANRKAGADCRDERKDLTCLGKVAAASGDFAKCQNLRSYTEMDICALTFAFRKGDAAACASIREERLRAACLEIAKTRP